MHTIFVLPTGTYARTRTGYLHVRRCVSTVESVPSAGIACDCRVDPTRPPAVSLGLHRPGSDEAVMVKVYAQRRVGAPLKTYHKSFNRAVLGPPGYSAVRSFRIQPARRSGDVTPSIDTTLSDFW